MTTTSSLSIFFTKAITERSHAVILLC